MIRNMVLLSVHLLLEPIDPRNHMLLMGSPPINPPAGGAPEEFLLMIIDKVRDAHLRFLTRHFREKIVAEEAAREKRILPQGDVTLPQEGFHLKMGIVLLDIDDLVLWPSGTESGISGYNRPALLTGQS
jgi:hypothetical protein